MDTFDGFQKKASGFLYESMRILKDGLKEAGRLVSATADATRMHIEKESHVLETHRELHRLGEKVYGWVKEHADAAAVDLDDTMRGIIARIRQAEDEVARHRERLNHMSVVNVPEQPMEDAGGHATGNKAAGNRAPRKHGETKKAKPRSSRHNASAS